MMVNSQNLIVVETNFITTGSVPLVTVKVTKPLLVAVLVASFGVSVANAASPTDDKARIAEFQTTKINLMLHRPGVRMAEMKFEKLEVVDGVINFKLTWADGSPGEVFVPINKKGIKPIWFMPFSLKFYLKILVTY